MSMLMSLDIVVVHDDVTPHAAVLALMPSGDVAIRHVRSAAAALQLAKRTACSRWLVHVSLPDVSGFECISMIRDVIATPAHFYVISDTYSPEEERRSFELGVARYLCEPIHSVFLSQLLGIHMSRPPPRQLQDDRPVTNFRCIQKEKAHDCTEDIH